MKRKVFGIPGLALVAGLGVTACDLPPPTFGGAIIEVSSRPPAPRPEMRPRPIYAGAVWIEGRWEWRGQWFWVPGYWSRPQVGWRWVPHQWAMWHGRWRYVPGHWQRV